MPDTPAPLFLVPEPCELPDALAPLVEELAARLLVIGRSRAHDPTEYTDSGAGAARAATADARAILHALRSRLDELAPEVAELRDALRDANGRADWLDREGVRTNDERRELQDALNEERRTIGELRTDVLMAKARARTVAGYLRRDAATASSSTDAERMTWAAGMLDGVHA